MQDTQRYKKIQPEREHSDENAYTTINDINTVTEMNVTQLNGDPETGGEYSDDVTNQSNTATHSLNYVLDQ